MKKYVYYCNIGQMPPGRAHQYMATAVKAIRDMKFIRPYEKILCIGVQNSDSVLEAIKVPFFEALSTYIDWYLGEVKDVDTIK